MEDDLHSNENRPHERFFTFTVEYNYQLSVGCAACNIGVSLFFLRFFSYCRYPGGVSELCATFSNTNQCLQALTTTCVCVCLCISVCVSAREVAFHVF